MAMNCPRCGAQVLEGASSCPNCGASLAPQAYQPAAPPPAPYISPPAQTSGLAIASLVTSIVGWVALPIFGHIAGVIMGYMAKNDIRRSGGALGGEGLATAGITIGYIGLALAILVTFVAIYAVALTIFGCTVCTLCASIGSAIPTPIPIPRN